MIVVAKDNTGDFTTIQEAIDSIKTYPEEIYVKRGVYYENLQLRHSDVSIIGEDREGTIITYNNYADMILENGERRGTFRSYSFFAKGDNITLKNLTIENSAGFGSVVGQAVALFIEGDNIVVSNCKLLGHQDTLYTGPLPKKEMQPGGFAGPTQNEERIVGKQLYEKCFISGEVDFIFGSAIAFFDDCEIYCLNCGKEINGYVTAPSTYEGCKYGYVFNNCRITGNCQPASFYLGRPWRNFGKTAYINCELGDLICPEGFHDWNKPNAHETMYFAEYNCSGPGADTSKRASFVHQLTDEEALEYTKEKVLSYKFN